MLALVLSLGACEKDNADVENSPQTNSLRKGLKVDKLSEDLKQRVTIGPEGSITAALNSPSLQARSTNVEVESLVDLFVGQFATEDELSAYLYEIGYPAWEVTLLPGEGYGENVFVTPVIKENVLMGNLFVFYDDEKPLEEHRMDYYSYEYTDLGYYYGGYFMSSEELNGLYMVAGGQATSQYMLLGNIDSAAVYFRYHVDEAGGIGGELAGRSSNCSILFCDGITTSLPPGFYGNDPTAGNGGNDGGGGGGSWPPTADPLAPGWHHGYSPVVGDYGSTGGSGSLPTINWPTIRLPKINIKWPPFGIGGGGIPCPWVVCRRTFPDVGFTLTVPDITNRLNSLESLSSNLEQRSGNCRWIQVYDVQDISMYSYLGSFQLGEDWASDINGFDCRGISFANEAMSIDFARSIENILAEIGMDWELIACLAANSEYAAAANAALDHYSGSTTCDGSSIADVIGEKLSALCEGEGNGATVDDLVRELGEAEWFDESSSEAAAFLILSGIEESTGVDIDCETKSFLAQSLDAVQELETIVASPGMSNDEKGYALQAAIEEHLVPTVYLPSSEEFTNLFITSYYLQTENPSWPKWKVIAVAYSKVIVLGQTHTLLDVIGLIPGLGEPADGLNGVIYVFEGDYVNAGISFGALIPILGSVGPGGRIVKKVFQAVKTAAGGTSKLILKRTADGLIQFCSTGPTSCRSQLARILGPIADHQAHHIIPVQFWDHAKIQELAERGVFHMNDKGNGLMIHTTQHSGSHRAYDNAITQLLESTDIANLNARLIQLKNQLAQHILNGGHVSTFAP